MDPKRLVLIRVGDAPNGTGYLIGPRLVLTSRHVVRALEEWLSVRVGHPVLSTELHRRGVRVCWPTSRDHVPDTVDVALLWLDEPVDVGGSPPVRWGRPAGAALLSYEGLGFPSFADDGGEPQVEHLRGDLPPAGTSRTGGGWVLDTPIWPEHRRGRNGASPWAGVSGSAVFCEGRLVGVVTEADPALGQRRLHAQPVHPLFGIPRFADLLSRHGDRRILPDLESVEARKGPVHWPVLEGRLPPEPSAFQPRTAVCEVIDEARERSGTVVLSQVLAGQGGVGKTQLAAHYARRAIDEGTDLVMWVDATRPAGVLEAYARTAVKVRVPGVGGQPETVEQDAAAFLAWLATTERSWLVVLDNITDQTLGDLWPATSRGGRGRVIATSRLRGAEASDAGRALVDVGVYSACESASYLNERLEAARCSHLLDAGSADLAEALGHLPLALAYAAAYMIQRRRSSSQYLQSFRERGRSLEEVLPGRDGVDGYQLSVAVALLLSLDAVRQEDPLTVHVLVLASLLDPAGHPEALWATVPVLEHLARAGAVGRERGTMPRVEEVDALDALAVLHNYSLVTLTEEPNRQVTIHALTARATLDTTPVGEHPHSAAADALLALWPGEDHENRELAVVLRANAEALQGNAGGLLWHFDSADPHAHHLLFRYGDSLIDAGLAAAATAHWNQLALDGGRLLGPDHPDALRARAHLAIAYRQAGRFDDAVSTGERALADLERLLGPDHPHTLATRGNLALAHQQAGHLDGAVAIGEQVLAGYERALGPDHPRTLIARGILALCYEQAGRTGHAMPLLERAAADNARILGPDHPNSLTARGNLALGHQEAGRTAHAAALLEQLVADCRRVLGPDHPDTLGALGNLADSYHAAGRNEQALAVREQVLADRVRLLGPDHPHSLTARAGLALSYFQVGRTDEAVRLEEEVAADSARVLGPDHPHTFTARGNLASSCWQVGRGDEAVALLTEVAADQARLLGTGHPRALTARIDLAALLVRTGRTDEAASLLGQVMTEAPDSLAARGVLAACHRRAGRTGEALALLERLAADSVRARGAEHPETIGVRAELAVCLLQAGDTAQAVTLLERVAVDRTRVLGSDHPDTLTTRGDLALARQEAGLTADAVTLLERVAADHARVLGPHHPDTLTARGNLATAYHQAGRLDDAVDVGEEVLADKEQLLGSDHP
ncbi:tetratricopeptide repeat protein, partial [Kitasatospora sp. MBT63]|uniref:tetratricopeptide repeat protein n=1 Tax=Kitasatospora sp. MBT63 TaxID=1444768 RepID=UPI0018F50F45